MSPFSFLRTQQYHVNTTSTINRTPATGMRIFARRGRGLPAVEELPGVYPEVTPGGTSGAEHSEIWIPVVRDDGLNLSTDAEKFASCQSVAPDDGLDVSVNATKLAVWKSVVLGDDRNLGVSAKELVRWKLVSTEAGLTFSVDTVAVSS